MGTAEIYLWILIAISFYIQQDVPNGNNCILHFLLKIIINIEKLSKFAKISIVLTVLGLVTSGTGILSTYIQQTSAQDASQEEDNKALVMAL